MRRTCRRPACPTAPSSSPSAPSWAHLVSQSCSGAPSSHACCTALSRRLPWRSTWPTTSRCSPRPPRLSTNTAITNLVRHRMWYPEEVCAGPQGARSHRRRHHRQTCSSRPLLELELELELDPGLHLEPTLESRSTAMPPTEIRHIGTRTGTRASCLLVSTPPANHPRTMWTPPTVPRLVSTTCDQIRGATLAHLPLHQVPTLLGSALHVHH